MGHVVAMITWKLEKEFAEFCESIPLNSVEIEELLGLRDGTTSLYPGDLSSKEFKTIQTFMRTYRTLPPLVSFCHWLADSRHLEQ